DHDDPFRRLEARDAAFGEPRAASIEVETGWAHDERAHPLAQARIGLADDDRVTDVGVGLQQLLDLGDADVLAAPDDHVLLAAGDVDRAVARDRGEVAGAEP